MSAPSSAPKSVFPPVLTESKAYLVTGAMRKRLGLASFASFLLALVQDAQPHAPSCLALLPDNAQCDCEGNCLDAEVPCACTIDTRGCYAYDKNGRLDSGFLQKQVGLFRSTDGLLQHCIRVVEIDAGSGSRVGI